MLKHIKLLKELEKRVTLLEKALECVNNRQVSDQNDASYKEVFDEWLNGKRT